MSLTQFWDDIRLHSKKLTYFWYVHVGGMLSLKENSPLVSKNKNTRKHVALWNATIGALWPFLIIVYTHYAFRHVWASHLEPFHFWRVMHPDIERIHGSNADCIYVASFPKRHICGIFAKKAFIGGFYVWSFMVYGRNVFQNRENLKKKTKTNWQHLLRLCIYAFEIHVLLIIVNMHSAIPQEGSTRLFAMWCRRYFGVCSGGVCVGDLCRRDYIGVCRGGVCMNEMWCSNCIGVCMGGVCVRGLCCRTYIGVCKKGASDLCRRTYIGVCSPGVCVSDLCRHSDIGVCKGGACVSDLRRRIFIVFCRGIVCVSDLCRRSFIGDCKGGVSVSDLWRPTRVFSKSVLQKCQGRVSSKTVLQECRTNVSIKSVLQMCHVRMLYKSVM